MSVVRSAYWPPTGRRPDEVSWIVLAIGVVAAVAAGSSAVSTQPSLATGGVPMANFTSNCRFSHGNNDDPIMYPGQPGTSHAHSYFGNVSTNASSTLASLRRAGSSCHRRGRPSRVLGADARRPAAAGRPPLNASVYYIRATVKPVRAFPAGLRMIAGNADATKPQRYILVELRPDERPARRRAASRPARRAPTRPPADGDLPGLLERPRPRQPRPQEPHGVHGQRPLPLLAPGDRTGAVADDPLSRHRRSRIPPRVRGAYSGHADFINSWNEHEAVRLVRDCLNAGRECGSHH